MGADTTSILCSGDLHLGRHPSRVDSGDKRFSVTAVWDRIVDAAIDHDVDAVALTGDVVDRDNRYYEALGPLERGIRRLSDRGIRTVAVSGNHDHDVLPLLAEHFDEDDFLLLGSGGNWTRHRLETSDGRSIDFVGWSYPDRHVRRSPIAELDLDTDSETPVVGLLHADLDVPDSRYAPVTTAELDETPVTTWLLGHIHVPTLRKTPAGSQILYPGSPQPLDPTETGVHGPWVVEINRHGESTCRQLPLANLRYESLQIPLDGVETEPEFDRIVTETLRDDLRTLATSTRHLERVVYRLRATGRTALHRRLPDLRHPLVTDLELTFDGVVAGVDELCVETSPDLDLEQLATGHDPPGVLAKLLFEIRTDEMGDEARALFRTLRKRLKEIHRSNAYAPLRVARTDDEPDDQWLRQQVVTEGMSLLDEMLTAAREKHGG